MQRKECLLLLSVYFEYSISQSQLAATFLSATPPGIHVLNNWPHCHMANKSVYDFSAETLDGQPVPLCNYRGKVLLIVNVATF
uniref:Glutathione peroxidase n=1 Tax=Lates calcarifer TaxID=8187 RepID=A0A4W6F5J0_LATCA